MKINNDFYLVKRVNCDPSNFNEKEKNILEVVSFKIEVLDKYRNNNNYELKLPGNVVTLSSTQPGWSLQLDVNDNFGYVSTFLYKFGLLPDSDQKHFADHNIAPEKLSQIASRRWVQGQPKVEIVDC